MLGIYKQLGCLLNGCAKNKRVQPAIRALESVVRVIDPPLYPAEVIERCSLKSTAPLISTVALFTRVPNAYVSA